MPCALPTQRFPSRSSNSAVTAPLDHRSRSSNEETPRGLTLKSPPAVPIQTFESRSLAIARAWMRLRAGGTPALVSSAPFHRATPLSVPTHKFFSPSESRQLIFRSGKPFVIADVSRPRRRKSPASRVPIQISPSGVSAIEITGERGRADAGASVSNPLSRYIIAPLSISEKRSAPFFDPYIAVTPEYGQSRSDLAFLSSPFR